MPFCLSKEESFPDGIRRIVTEQLEKAASSLPTSGAKPEKVDCGVHEARRNIKKVRGVLRLIQPQLHAAYIAETAQLRALGGRLGDLRDAAVMLEVFDGLQVAGEERFAAIRQGLLTDLEDVRNRSDLAELLGETRKGLQRVSRRVEDWRVPQDLETVTHSGFNDTYRRGQSALQEAAEKPTPEALHQLRKRVKEHRFHLSLLGDKGSTKRLEELRELEVLLGDHHNLSLLRERLERSVALYGGSREVSAFVPRITGEQRRLQARALPLGRRVYLATDPSQWVVGSGLLAARATA